MKKYLVIAAVAISFANCSNNEDSIISDSLTPVSLKIETNLDNSSSSRAVWTDPSEDDKGQTTIVVKFEPNETMDVYECGYTNSQTFSCIDKAEYQNGNFSGNWHVNGTRWAAVLPSGAANSVTVSETGNTYNLTLPATQTTRVKTYTTGTITKKTTYVVSPDNNANVLVGSKDTHSTETCFLSPICAYLYFATDPSITTVKIVTAGDDPISGSLVVGTGVNKTKSGSYEWDGWENFVNCIKTITPTTTIKEITANGALTHRDDIVGDLMEYVVCIFPTTYKDLKITTEDGKTILAQQNTSCTYDLVNLYYLGKIGNSNAKQNFILKSFDLTKE